MSDHDITRTRLERILKLDERIRAGLYPNCSTFARYWADRIGSGRPVDRKTIQRDIDWLRDMHSAPIAWSAAEKGFYYTEPSWSLPMLQLTEGELFSLLLARQMGKMYQGTNIADRIRTMFDKISVILSEPVEVDPVLFGGSFSFHSHPSRPIDSRIWETIYSALRKRRILNITYKRLSDRQASERRVEPVHLANVDDDWYLAGYCLQNNAWRHFSVSRIVKASLSNKPFTPREDFDADAYFANRFGKFIAPPGEPPYMVSILFSKASAPVVLERIWHPAQTIRKNRDGSLVLTVPIPSLVEAKRFCLGWGKEAEVLEPDVLRREMAAEASEMGRHYRTPAGESFAAIEKEMAPS